MPRKPLTTLYGFTFAIALLSYAPVQVLGATYLERRAELFRQTSGTAKAGLAWPNGNYEIIKQFESDKVSWYYTWSPNPVNSDLNFIPMLWGKTQIDAFQSTIHNTIQKYQVNAVLGFNEPQQSGQSNLSPEEGAELWKQYLEPLKSAYGVRLGSPAPSSAPSGKTWIQDFLTACNGGCSVDFIALHWYDVNATDFIEYLQDFHNTFQRPIWVTEWACQNFNNADKQCSYDDIRAFMGTTQGFMDSADWVERYSWFGAFRKLQGVNPDDGLLDPNTGVINQLGQQYIGSNTTVGGPQPANAALGMAPFSAWSPFLLTIVIGMLIALV